MNEGQRVGCYATEDAIVYAKVKMQCPVLGKVKVCAWS